MPVDMSIGPFTQVSPAGQSVDIRQATWQRPKVQDRGLLQSECTRQVLPVGGAADEPHDDRASAKSEASNSLGAIVGSSLETAAILDARSTSTKPHGWGRPGGIRRAPNRSADRGTRRHPEC